MLMIEDISSEKRLKSTMSRYMDPGIADKLVASGADMLGGQSVEATVLFYVDGRLHPARGRDARQVHRRRHHGRLRDSGGP
jgi:hypothetical protein